MLQTEPFTFAIFVDMKEVEESCFFKASRRKKKEVVESLILLNLQSLRMYFMVFVYFTTIEKTMVPAQHLKNADRI